jgi:hypothetical protein
LREDAALRIPNLRPVFDRDEPKTNYEMEKQMATTMAVPTATGGTDQLPSGSWGFGPISIQWSIEPNNEVDVQVSVLGINVDKLSGTLSSSQAGISDTLNVLGIVNGSLGLAVKYGQGPSADGLWISGQVTAGSWNSGALNHRLIAW